MADEKKSSQTIHTVYIVIIVVLLLVIGGGFMYLHKKQTSDMMASNYAGGNGKMMAAKNGKGMNMMMMMTAVTPPALSDQQKQQITEGSDKSSMTKTFNITGGNFYFVPNKITVNKGDKVTFVMTNSGGFHDLMIDELGVKTPMIKTGEAETATFTASKKGSFVYYCSVKGHHQKGMWGTLTVQ